MIALYVNIIGQLNMLKPTKNKQTNTAFSFFINHIF